MCATTIVGGRECWTIRELGDALGGGAMIAHGIYSHLRGPVYDPATLDDDCLDGCLCPIDLAATARAHGYRAMWDRTPSRVTFERRIVGAEGNDRS